MKYHFRIHQEKKGYWAECLELEGCITQGDSIEELCDNMQEALNLYISEPENSKYLASLPDHSIRTSKEVVEVGVSPEVAFAFLVRYYRIKHGLTQQQVANKMGIENIYNYQRLESKSCNPSLKTIARVKEVFPEFSLDAAISL